MNNYCPNIVICNIIKRQKKRRTKHGQKKNRAKRKEAVGGCMYDCMLFAGHVSYFSAFVVATTACHASLQQQLLTWLCFSPSLYIKHPPCTPAFTTLNAIVSAYPNIYNIGCNHIFWPTPIEINFSHIFDGDTRKKLLTQRLGPVRFRRARV